MTNGYGNIELFNTYINKNISLTSALSQQKNMIITPLIRFQHFDLYHSVHSFDAWHTRLHICEEDMARNDTLRLYYLP